MDGLSAEYYLHKANASQRFREAPVMYYGHMHRAGAARRRRGTFVADREGLRRIISPGREEGGCWRTSGSSAPLAGARAGCTPSSWRRRRWWRSRAIVAVLCGLVLRRAVRHKTAAIDRQARRLLTLIDTLPDLVWFKSADGQLLACNKRFERFIGAPENELLGLSGQRVPARRRRGRVRGRRPARDRGAGGRTGAAPVHAHLRARRPPGAGGVAAHARLRLARRAHRRAEHRPRRDAAARRRAPPAPTQPALPGAEQRARGHRARASAGAAVHRGLPDHGATTAACAWPGSAGPTPPPASWCRWPGPARRAPTSTRRTRRSPRARAASRPACRRRREGRAGSTYRHRHRPRRWPPGATARCRSATGRRRPIR